MDNCWDFKLGEEEVSSKVQELADEMSPFNSRPFHKYLLRHKPGIRAVISLHEQVENRQGIKFVKLPKDYKTRDMGRRLNRGWYSQEIYDLPEQTIANLGEDFCQVTNELKLLSDGQVLRYCFGENIINHDHLHGFFWIDKGEISLSEKNIVFGTISGLSYLTPITFPFSRARGSKITHFGDVAVDDLLLAYALNLNEGVKRFRK